MTRRALADAAHDLSWALLVLSVALMITLSAPTLAFLGVPYDLPGGPMPVKLHPSTYTLCLACGLGLAGRGNPVAVALAVARQWPLLVLYLGGMVFAALWGVWLHGSSGAAFFVDALWMPGVALITAQLQPRSRQRRLLVLIVTLLALNALLALAEHARGQTFIPQHVGQEGVLPDAYFRASALLGHPLANALITVSLMPVALTLPLGGFLQATLLGLFALAMLAFGGRAALLAGLGVYGAAGVTTLAWRALQGTYSYRQWTGGLLLGLLGAAAAASVVLATGLGERIFANLAWDNSANVRLVVLDALGELDTMEWWTGVSAARLELIKLRIGLDPLYEAIENYWVALLMQVGLLGFLPFLLGLACGVTQVWRLAPVPLRLGILVFFLVGSGANTLSSKTVSLSLLFLAAPCAAAFRPDPRVAAVRTTSPWRPVGGPAHRSPT